MSKKIPLSIYLSKPKTSIDECFDFDGKEKPTEIHLESNKKYTSKSYIGLTPQDPPDWFTFLRSYATPSGKGEITKKESKNNASLSGILVIRIPAFDRCFIFCFGYGKKYLNSEITEKHFGRNVVLNTAKEEQIISIRTKSYEGKPWFKEMQSVITTNLYEFDLNCRYELLQKVAAELEGVIPTAFIEKIGKKTRDLISKKITGYESVNINADLSPAKNYEFCEWLHKQFSSQKYKQVIPDIDVFESVREQVKIDELNTELLMKLKTKAISNLYLVTPEKHDVETIDNYIIEGTSYDSKNTMEYLNLNDYLEDLGSKSKLGSISIKTLKDNKVIAFQGTVFRGKWSIFRCLTGEITKDKCVYALMDGEWYQIKQSFYDEILANLNTRLINSLPLSPFEKGHHKDEGGYNKEMAKKPDMQLFDRQLKASKIGQEIEPCDLLYKADYFIHVKRSKSSSDLSHLFGQGVVANELLLVDDIFKNNFLNDIEKPNDKNVEKNIQNKKYVICFGIIVENRKTLDPTIKIQNIPAFSILNLSRVVEVIEKIGTGIQVKIQLISVVPSTKVKTVLKKKP